MNAEEIIHFEQSKQVYLHCDHIYYGLFLQLGSQLFISSGEPQFHSFQALEYGSVAYRASSCLFYQSHVELVGELSSVRKVLSPQMSPIVLTAAVPSEIKQLTRDGLIPDLIKQRALGLSIHQHPFSTLFGAINLILLSPLMAKEVLFLLSTEKVHNLTLVLFAILNF